MDTHTALTIRWDCTIRTFIGLPLIYPLREIMF